MEKLNLKESNPTKDDNQNNQLESPLTDKYDSAESQTSDQSDQEIKTDLVNNHQLKKVDLNLKIVNLSIDDVSNEKHQFRKKSNSLQNDEHQMKSDFNKTAVQQFRKLSEVQGHKNNEMLVKHTKERMTQKFDLLEKETGVKLKKSTLNSENSQETLSSNDLNDGFKTDLNDHSSPEVLDYANSHDSESVSSFEVRHTTISAEKVKEQAAIRLEFELQKAQKDLKLRDEEIAKLSKIRREVEIELEDLTASLFEEANRMVQEAKHQKSKSDKALKEATMKNDVLQAEVKALKVLVRNSIPNSIGNSKQNSVKSTRSTATTSSQSKNSLDLIKNQFTPKLIKSPKNSLRAMIARTSIPFHSKTSKTSVKSLMKSEKRSCKKSPSNYELASEMTRYLNDSNQNDTTTLETLKEETNQCINDLKQFGEIDPIYYEEFLGNY